MSPAVRLFVVGVMVSVAGCAEYEGEEPQTPSRVAAPRMYGTSPKPPDMETSEQAYEAVEMPVVRDNFWQIAASDFHEAPAPRRPSISLGYIGDEPLGENGPTGPQEGPWWRPFPPSWERSFHTYGYPYYFGHYGGRRRYR